jgi:20S proteasome subunit alpha 3
MATLTRENGKTKIKVLPQNKVNELIKKFEAEEEKKAEEAKREKEKEKEREKAAKS